MSTSDITNVTSGLDGMVTTAPSTNQLEDRPALDGVFYGDATWVLICTFIIFTMQSGFALLESGCVSMKNEVNILYKNAADLICGGTVYWLIGYGLAFGSTDTAGFVGSGKWAVDPTLETLNANEVGDLYQGFVFQLSFATTATTIVSGAVAERVRLHSYIIFAMLMTFAYAIPSHWIWDENGWLRKMGVVDIAGSGVVHLCGGTAALMGAVVLGPRKGRYDHGLEPPPLGNGTNLFLGTFFLWWGWLGFNCGSVYGVQGSQWQSAARTAATTLVGSMGGGIIGILYSLIRSKGKKYYPTDLTNGVLGGLVGITAPCAVVNPWEAFIIGFIGGLIALLGVKFFDKLHVDDPVGAISVHGLSGIWGLLSVGLFMRQDNLNGLNGDLIGAFHGGGGKSFGIQLLAAVVIIAWAGAVSLIIALSLHFSPLGFRMTEEEEAEGADPYEHGIKQDQNNGGGNGTNDTNAILPSDKQGVHPHAFGTRQYSAKLDKAPAYVPPVIYSDVNLQGKEIGQNNQKYEEDEVIQVQL